MCYLWKLELWIHPQRFFEHRYSGHSGKVWSPAAVTNACTRVPLFSLWKSKHVALIFYVKDVIELCFQVFNAVAKEIPPWRLAFVAFVWSHFFIALAFWYPEEDYSLLKSELVKRRCQRRLIETGAVSCPRVLTLSFLLFLSWMTAGSPSRSWSACWGASQLVWSICPTWTTSIVTWLPATSSSTATWCAKSQILAFLAS